MPEFPILEVDPASVIGDEALGSKPKFWFRNGDFKYLFKEARDNTGEDWAEKIAAEAAHLIDMPAAQVELAVFQGRRGCASKSFINEAQGDALIHGNEILAGVLLGYKRDKRFRQSDHTLDNIASAIRKLLPDSAVHDHVLRVLAEYIIFDALISNTDRHHENWALVFKIEQREGLPHSRMDVAPSFDHASSLGRELLDDRRRAILNAKRIPHYVRNGHGGIYLGVEDARGANPLRLAEFGARRFPKFFSDGLERVAAIQLDALEGIVDRVPDSRMSHDAKDFVKALLRFNVESLRSLQ